MKEELDEGSLGHVVVSPDTLCSDCGTPETGIRFQYLFYQYRSRKRVWHPRIRESGQDWRFKAREVRWSEGEKVQVREVPRSQYITFSLRNLLTF